jgi:hypothetical protein
MDFDKLKNSRKSEIMRNNYKKWKIKALDESGYFVIFQGFLESGLLKNISGNALKLYIYLGLNASNIDGIVWHSNEKISIYFGKSERSVRLWMNELVTINLIKRIRLKYNGNVYTHLIPYTYKCEPETENDFNQIIEGYLYIDELNSLYIKGNNVDVPITSSMYIEIWNSNEYSWVKGKIEIRRSIENWILDESKSAEKIRYVFKSYDKRLLINIENDNPLRVKLYIL